MTDKSIHSRHPIVGSWRLTSFTEQNLETGAISYPFGEGAKALVIYEANGYVATIFTRSDRKPPLGHQPTDQEAIGQALVKQGVLPKEAIVRELERIKKGGGQPPEMIRNIDSMITTVKP